MLPYLQEKAFGFLYFLGRERPSPDRSQRIPDPREMEIIRLFIDSFKMFISPNG